MGGSMALSRGWALVTLRTQRPSSDGRTPPGRSLQHLHQAQHVRVRVCVCVVVVEGGGGGNTDDPDKPTWKPLNDNNAPAVVEPRDVPQPCVRTVEACYDGTHPTHTQTRSRQAAGAAAMEEMAAAVGCKRHATIAELHGVFVW